MLKKLNNYEAKSSLAHLFSYQKIVNQKWDIIKYYENSKVVGFYEKRVSHQRNGMNSEFNSFYQRGKYNFVLQEDFEKAYKCVLEPKEYGGNIEFMPQKKIFKETFLDSCKAGSSYMCLSH